jgi:metal iron transporter
MSVQSRNDYLSQTWRMLRKYYKFIGPGILVSVSYMDPGNYSTSVSSGAMYEYKLLFIIFMSNIFAVILQCLCIKLGTVTGLDLAEMCRLNLPYYINLPLYICAELAIIATDLAEVVGTAIALEILFGIPLVYGVLVTILDVLVVLCAYDKEGSMKQTRLFETMVSLLVLGTCVCFILELFECDFPPGSLWLITKGFLPVSSDIFKERDAIFLSCGIIGATVMPHSLYLGSALVQPRLKEFDLDHGFVNQTQLVAHEDDEVLPQTTSKLSFISDGSKLSHKYKPSYHAIKYCLSYSYTELIISLFVLAVFVNSSILIVAGCTLFNKPDAEDADLLSIYEMLSHYISPFAGLLFAMSMLFSGQSAGIVCTMAGQIISEGFINWSFQPWIRRLFTRTLAIIPVLVVIMALGREGVSKVMNSSQVILSFILPIVSAPLIYFTCQKNFMTVYDTSPINENTSLLQNDNTNSLTKYTFENGSFFRISAILTWSIISFLNIYLLYAFANGASI